MAREVDLGSVVGPQGPQGPQGETGPTGPQGPKGEDGKSVTIKGSVDSTSQLPQSGNSVGDGYIIDGNLHVWDGSEWNNVGKIQGPQGDKGEKGDKGDPWQISKTYESVDEMNGSYDTDGLPIGAIVAIDTGDVNDADTGKVYVKGEVMYEYLLDLSGAQGIKGDKGDKGEKGDTGAKGATGSQGPKGDPGETPTFEIRSGHLYAIFEN